MMRSSPERSRKKKLDKRMPSAFESSLLPGGVGCTSSILCGGDGYPHVLPKALGMPAASLL